MTDAAVKYNASVSDLLRGAREIRDYLNEKGFDVSLSQTHYLIRKKLIPVGKLGPKSVIASKRRIDRHIDSNTA